MKYKMNIAFIYFRPFVPEYGGVERVTDILAKELIKKGHNVKYLSFYKLDTDYKLPVENYYFPNQEYINEENIVFFLVDDKN